MKKQFVIALCAGLILASCGSTTNKEAEDTHTGESEITAGETADDAEKKAEENGKETTEEVGTQQVDDAASYADKVDNATIDAAVYLDYSIGIEKGVYRWVSSEDGDYYTLAAIGEDGEPLTAQESAINVGANNEEVRGGQMPGGDRGFSGDDNMSKPEGKIPPDGKGKPQGGMEGGFGPGENGGGFGGMPGGFGNEGQSVYQGVYMNANITNLNNQTMLIYVPAAYFNTDDDGNVIGINHEGTIGSYTADSAPIVYLNECGGWRSSSPRSCDSSYIKEGMIYVTAGARSRDAYAEDGTTHTGKAPTQMADLKSGIIELRANEDVIPGDKNKIVSIGTSGGGQMSSILGASGNMSEYYPYMYEAGTLGVIKKEDGSYESAYADNIYGAQNFCPIADIENADMAYAWWWVNLDDKGGVYNGSITDFEKRLQELLADAFTGYINGLNLKDSEGNELTLAGLRKGSYYDAILKNISDALNAMVESEGFDPQTEYSDYDSWLVKNDDGTWSVTDLDGFMIGTGLVNSRNKAIPGFDTMDKSAENDAFGKPEEDAVHFSAATAQILSDNYEELSALDGFDKENVDDYIAQALTGDEASDIKSQTDLLNATEIMLGSDGYKAVDPAKHWRNRSGTADQHTSFSVGFNILLAARSLGLDTDYALVWNMPHGSDEGSSTGTFIDWVNEISSQE